MGLLRKVISIRPNQIGYLYKNNKFQRILNPGIYRLFDFFRELDVIIIPTVSKLITVTNQEVLTKDNISLRLSYILEYQITESEVFTSRFDLLNSPIKQRFANLIAEAENIVHSFSQVYLREEIANVVSQELSDRRKEIFNTIPEGLKSKLSNYGIYIHQLVIKDIYFPKTIQQLFAQQLEAKIRSKLDLENAKTTVATARALKNAAELMKNNENIKFIQYLETITKIAAQGKHTFVVGNLKISELGK